MVVDAKHVNHSCIVALTSGISALVVHKMVLDRAFCLTIAANNNGTFVIKFLWHGFIANHLIDLFKVLVHIREGAHTKGALIILGSVILKALGMHGVSAAHEHDGFSGCEKITSTDRTIGMQGVAHTNMVRFGR